MAYSPKFKRFAQEQGFDPDDLQDKIVKTVADMMRTMDSRDGSRRRFKGALDVALSGLLDDVDDNGNQFEGTGTGDPDDTYEDTPPPKPGEGAIDARRRRRYAADDPAEFPGMPRPGGSMAQDSFPGSHITLGGSDDRGAYRRTNRDGLLQSRWIANR